MTKEINEISKELAGRYVNKAATDLAIGPRRNTDKNYRRYINRKEGIGRAVKKLTKEEVEMNENTQTMVAAAIQDKPDDFMQAFNDAVLDKIQPIIDDYKLQLQKYFLGVEEVPEEEVEEDVEAEIDEDNALAMTVPLFIRFMEANPEATEEEAIEAVLAELEVEEVDESDEVKASKKHQGKKSIRGSVFKKR